MRGGKAKSRPVISPPQQAHSWGSSISGSARRAAWRIAASSAYPCTLSRRSASARSTSVAACLAASKADCSHSLYCSAAASRRLSFTHSWSVRRQRLLTLSQSEGPVQVAFPLGLRNVISRGGSPSSCSGEACISGLNLAACLRLLHECSRVDRPQRPQVVLVQMGHSRWLLLLFISCLCLHVLQMV